MDETQLYAYIDASHGVHHDGKSHAGYSLTMGRGTVDASSGKLPFVTKSSAESELVAVSEKASKIIAARNYHSEASKNDKPVLVGQDNQSTIRLIDVGRPCSDRTKHIATRHFWTKERVESGELKIRYVPTDHMIADILTKPIQGEQFRTLRDQLLGHVEIYDIK